MLKCYYIAADERFLYNKGGTGNPSHKETDDAHIPLIFNLNLN